MLTFLLTSDPEAVLQWCSMTPLAITVLVATCALIAALAGVGVLAAGLWWSVTQLRPHNEVRAEVSELKAMVESLEAQVTTLRTKKAGRTSAARRAEEAETDPRLAGLTPEEQALFQGLEN